MEAKREEIVLRTKYTAEQRKRLGLTFKMTWGYGVIFGRNGELYLGDMYGKDEKRRSSAPILEDDDFVPTIKFDGQ